MIQNMVRDCGNDTRDLCINCSLISAHQLQPHQCPSNATYQWLCDGLPSGPLICHLLLLLTRVLYSLLLGHHGTFTHHSAVYSVLLLGNHGGGAVTQTQTLGW